MYFSTNKGIGLSLLRTQIQPAANTNSVCFGNANELSLMSLAIARGARVWSTPWTPPTFCKTTNSQNGGAYTGLGNSSTNLLYASELAGYVANLLKNQKISLYAISIQNEPEVSTTYPSCQWTAQQYHDFATNLYNALVASNVSSTKIILPEDEVWSSSYYTTAMNDPAVADVVSIIACHNYDGNSFTIPNYGKTLWETEVSTINDTYDGSITNGIYWAKRIHAFLTGPQVNAWHYWWLYSLNPDNEGLTDTSGNPAKRMYVLGQYSRFVRPNFYRINATTTGSALITAFKDSASPAFAIIAINSSQTTPITQTFNLTNFLVAGSVTPWVTSSNQSLVSETAIPVAGSSFTYTLPPLTVTTFVGQGSTNTRPILNPIANITNDIDELFSVTNSVTDSNVPPLTLTYHLVTGPTGASLDPSSGILTWLPPSSEAGTTNAIKLTVTDNGVPKMSATNTYNLIVNPLTPVSVSSITSSNGTLNLILNGPLGPTYTLQGSTDLITWSNVFVTNPVSLPFTVTESNLDNFPSQYFRVQIQTGP